MRNPEGFELRRSIAARTRAAEGTSTVTPFGPDPARVEDGGWLTILADSAGTISLPCAVIDLVDACAAAGIDASPLEPHGRQLFGRPWWHTKLINF